MDAEARGAAPLPPLRVLWRDERLVAIHKPAGWLVHRSPLDPQEHRVVLQHLRDQLGRPQGLVAAEEARQFVGDDRHGQALLGQQVARGQPGWPRANNCNIDSGFARLVTARDILD